MKLATTEELVEEAKLGKIFILADNEDRENEGDFICPAQFATPEVINFMVTHGRGLVCLTMEKSRIDALELPMMATRNDSKFQTAFTVSIEAREGTTTGISAFERAHTVATAIDPTKGANDIVTPGHVFPLVAEEGGVLARNGHTEASVDISRLAGHTPAAVICEILNDDGHMARLPDLMKIGEKHGIKVGTVADLIEYQRNH